METYSEDLYKISQKIYNFLFRMLHYLTITEMNRSETEESLDMILHSISLLKLDTDNDEFVNESISKVEKQFDIMLRDMKLLFTSMDSNGNINADDILLEAQIENFCKISEALTFHGKLFGKKFLKTILKCINS